MELLTVLIDSIASVGFPAVCCIMMFIHMQKNDERHREETDKMRTALENNTLALQRICDKCEGGK